MKKIGLVLGVIASFYALSACALMQPSGTWRYKMTVYVDTPEGMKSGSAVREIRAWDNTEQYNPIVGMWGGCGFDVKGEAVVVDLGERGTLFALLSQGGSSDYAHRVFYHTFPQPKGRGGECLAEGIRYYEQLEKPATEVPLRERPMMVVFKDRNDPTSVQLVYKVDSEEKRLLNDYGSTYVKTIYKPDDHFEELFGEGVKLAGVKIETTNERVTEEVRKWLPSYKDREKYMTWFRGLKYGDPLKIGPSDFKKNY